MRAPRLLARFGADRSGAVAILTGIALPILVGGMALGAEASFWYLSQRKLQQAGDLAAYAAAVQLRSGRSEAEMQVAAAAIAGSSGLRAGEDTMALSHPPASGDFAGVPSAVEIRLARQQVRFFTLIYSQDPVAIDARAVAQVRGGGDACLLALDPSGAGAITVGGSADITFDGCDVATNSVAADAFLMNGGRAELTTGCVNSVGGVSPNGNLALQTCDRSRTEAPPIPDPYADVAQPPEEGDCAADNGIGANGSATTVVPSQTMPDGTAFEQYCGGLTVRGDTFFEPGLYIVDGGTFSINSNASVSGDGVTFFLTGGASLSFNGTADVDFTAPASGPYSGLVFFGDRADSGISHTINGSAGSRLNGAVYLPSANLSYSGNFGGAGSCIQIVARRVEFTGNSELRGGCAAPGTRRIAVAETIALVE